MEASHFYDLFFLSIALLLVSNFAQSFASPERTMTSPKTVMVTGANGFLPSYIVKDLLESGHTVHACVRDASNPEKVSHLKSLPGAPERLKLFSTGDLAEVADNKAFDKPMDGCQAVIHAATPLNTNRTEEDMLKPAMISTQELLDCIGRNADALQCLVLTSSMAAVAPRSRPAVKDESYWSDPEEQKILGNWYGCTKTSQEQLVQKWVNEAKANGKLSKDFVYAAICPTLVIGPRLDTPDNPKESVGGTIGRLQKWLKEGRSEAPNDSFSFIHVEDCAKMHTRILELKASDINEHQRYMSLIESLHWNDILKLLKDLYPNMPDFKPYKGDDFEEPTQNDLSNMKSLGVPYRNTKETLQDSIDYLKKVGGLE